MGMTVSAYVVEVMGTVIVFVASGPFTVRVREVYPCQTGLHVMATWLAAEALTQVNVSPSAGNCTGSAKEVTSELGTSEEMPMTPKR